MSRQTRRDVLRIGGGVALALLGGATTVSAEEDEGAGLRVAHASPDAPAVDVLVDGDVAVRGLEFGSVTDYFELAAGEYTIEVKTTSGGTSVFGPTTVKLENEDYTAVALGVVFDEGTDFTVSIFEDTNGANLDDEARIRAIHASPDAGTVDVTVNDGALTLFDDLEFGTSSGYAVVDAGTYGVEVRPGSGGDPVLALDGVELVSGSTYTAFALGYATTEDESDPSEGFGLNLTEDASAPPRGDGNGRGRGGGEGDN